MYKDNVKSVHMKIYVYVLVKRAGGVAKWSTKKISKVNVCIHLSIWTYTYKDILARIYARTRDCTRGGERIYIWYRVTHVCVGGHICMCWCNIYDCHKSVTYGLCMCMSYMSWWHISARPYE